MKRLFILILFTLILVTPVLSLDCQYKETEKYEVKREKVVLGGTENIVGDPLKIETAGKNHNDEPQIKVTNTLNQEIEIEVKYTQIVSGLISDSEHKYEKTLEIDPNEEIKFTGQKEFLGIYDSHIISDSIEYEFIDPDLEVKTLLLERENESCKMCNGEVCLDDGEPCNFSYECGGGHCVEGYCSDSEKCYDNDCKCGPGEVQCPNDKECVKKNSTPLDVEPKCGLPEECISGYIANGTCKKSPSVIEEEKEKRRQFKRVIQITFTILVIIGISIVLYNINKRKKLEIQKLESEMKKTKYEIEKKNDELEELKSKQHKTQEQKDKIERLERELEEKRSEFKTKSKDFFMKKYKERYGKKIYFDKKREYFRFSDSDEYLHRYIYRTFYGKFNERNEIHHIDANHYNNEIWNLIELKPKTHEKVKHGRITYGDWESGIEELKKAGLSEDDFPEEVVKRLRNL